MLQKEDEVYVLLCRGLHTFNRSLPTIVKGKIFSNLTRYYYYGLYGFFLKCSNERYIINLPSRLRLINCKHISPMRYTTYIYQYNYNLSIPYECISKNPNSLCKKYLFALELYSRFVNTEYYTSSGREIIKTFFV